MDADPQDSVVNSAVPSAVTGNSNFNELFGLVVDSERGQISRNNDDNEVEELTMTSYADGSSPSREIATKTPIVESILFFFSAVGCTVGWTAVLSNLVYYTQTLGVNSFVWLNVAVYTPLLPITIAQALFDAYYDAQFESLVSFTFRGIVGYATTLIGLCLIPFTQDSLLWLSLVCLVMGTASAVLHGMLKQMASFIYPECGRLLAAVTAGLQASGILVLVVNLAVKYAFPKSMEEQRLREFYFYTAGVLVVCWLCFQVLLHFSDGVLHSLQQRDISLREQRERASDGNGQQAETAVAALREPLLSPGDDEENNGPAYQTLIAGNCLDDTKLDDEEALFLSHLEDSSFWKLWVQTWPLCVAVMVTVSSSMAVGSWLNRVPSSGTLGIELGTVLFYARLFGDLLGRPATLCCTCGDDNEEGSKSFVSVIALAVLRLGFVPFFFLYSSSYSSITRNDFAIVVGVTLFASTSGFVVTRCYQVAPTLLPPVIRKSQQNQTSLLNVCFSVAVLLGLATTLILQEQQ